jgi:hypothetical protein
MISSSMKTRARRGAGRTTAAAPSVGVRVSQWWGLLGVAVLFGFAVVRLGGRGVAAIAAGLSPLQWAVLVALTAVFVYGEGVRALQLKYIPFAVSRLEQLRDERGWWKRALAPLYAMALISAPAASLARAWAGSAAIIVAVAVVSRFPDPWRGITDFAVASALAWATVALIATGLRRLRP